MTREKGREKTERDRVVHPRWFTKETPEKKEKIIKFDGITSATVRDVSKFVKEVFTRRYPMGSGGLESLPFNRVAILRYLAMFECMRKIRVCGEDGQAARQAFEMALRKTCDDKLAS